MEQKWVVVGDELRMDKVNSYDELIGENGDIVKCYGTFEIDNKHWTITFKVVPFFEDVPYGQILSNIKKQGFYSPMLKNYKWKLGDNDIYI